MFEAKLRSKHIYIVSLFISIILSDVKTFFSPFYTHPGRSSRVHLGNGVSVNKVCVCTYAYEQILLIMERHIYIYLIVYFGRMLQKSSA